MFEGRDRKILLRCIPPHTLATWLPPFSWSTRCSQAALSFGPSASLILSPGMVVRDVALQTFRFAPSPHALRRGTSRLRPRVARVLQGNTAYDPCTSVQSPSRDELCVKVSPHLSRQGYMQNKGLVERPLRGLCGISACYPWGKKSQRAAVIPSGAPSAWMTLLSDFMKIVNDSYTVMAIPFIPGHPIHPGCPAHFQLSRPALRLWIPSNLSSGMEPYTIIRFGTIGYRTDGLFQIANTPQKDKSFIISVLQIESV